jgi:hypothetical protein
MHPCDAQVWLLVYSANMNANWHKWFSSYITCNCFQIASLKLLHLFLPASISCVPQQLTSKVRHNCNSLLEVITSTDKVPIVVIRGKLLADTSLHCVSPFGNTKFIIILEHFSVGADEGGGRNVPDSCSTHSEKIGMK